MQTKQYSWSEIEEFSAHHLQAKYRTDAALRAVVDQLASLQNSRTETNVDTLVRKLALARTAVVAALKALEAPIGAGIFVVGRKGKPSRIEWHPGGRPSELKSLAEQHRPDASSLKRPSSPVSTSKEPELESYRLRLRADLEVQLRLPADLTADEAQRISHLVLSLPLERVSGASR